MRSSDDLLAFIAAVVYPAVHDSKKAVDVAAEIVKLASEKNDAERAERDAGERAERHAG